MVARWRDYGQIRARTEVRTDFSNIYQKFTTYNHCAYVFCYVFFWLISLYF